MPAGNGLHGQRAKGPHPKLVRTTDKGRNRCPSAQFTNRPSFHWAQPIIRISKAPAAKWPCARVAAPTCQKKLARLLRSRLRTASLMLATGFGLFFLRNLFIANYSSPSEIGPAHFPWSPALTVVACRRFAVPKVYFELSTLRIAELAIFGVPALFFIAMQWLEMQAGLPFYIGITAPWMLLILTYSLYIPNSWQRAAWILGLFAATPVIICIVALFFVPEYVQSNPARNVSTVFMTMTLAAYIGTWGRSTPSTGCAAKRSRLVSLANTNSSGCSAPAAWEKSISPNINS